MRNSEVDVRIPADLADRLSLKVRTGAYASVNEAVTQGVQALLDHEDAVESWLCNDILKGHEEYVSDPTKGISGEDLLARLTNGRRSASPDR